MAAQKGPAVFFTFLCLLLELSSSHGARAVPPAPQESTAPSSTEFIRISCGATEYPALCFSSLSTYATTVHTSRAHLADVALSVALAGARSASTAMARALVAGGRGVAPRVAAAARDCVENVGDAVDELRESLAAMGKVVTTADAAGGGKKEKLAYQINSIQTWVSAALTDDDTCLDGFAGSAMDGKVKDVVRSHVVKVAQLSSNALALVNGLASSLPHL